MREMAIEHTVATHLAAAITQSRLDSYLEGVHERDGHRLPEGGKDNQLDRCEFRHRIHLQK